MDENGLFLRELQERLEALPAVVEAAYDSFHFYEGIVAIMDVLRLTNSFVQVIWADFVESAYGSYHFYKDIVLF
jgi:hypothetical protein